MNHIIAVACCWLLMAGLSHGDSILGSPPDSQCVAAMIVAGDKGWNPSKQDEEREYLACVSAIETGRAYQPPVDDTDDCTVTPL